MRLGKVLVMARIGTLIIHGKSDVMLSELPNLTLHFQHLTPTTNHTQAVKDVYPPPDKTHAPILPAQMQVITFALSPFPRPANKNARPDTTELRVQQRTLLQTSPSTVHNLRRPNHLRRLRQTSRLPESHASEEEGTKQDIL